MRDDDIRIPVQVVLRNLLRRLDREVEITVTPREGEIGIALGPGSERLPSDRGMTLQALEYLVARIVNQGREEWMKVSIDTGGRGKMRSTEIEEMARNLADQALAEGQDQKTETLSAQDRRLVHLALKDHPKLTTFSVGRGSYRRVVIALREGIPERRVDISKNDLSRSRYADGRSVKDTDSQDQATQERGSGRQPRRDQSSRRPRSGSGARNGAQSERSSAPPKRSGRRPRRRADSADAKPGGGGEERKPATNQKQGDPSSAPASENGGGPVSQFPPPQTWRQGARQPRRRSQ